MFTNDFYWFLSNVCVYDVAYIYHGYIYVYTGHRNEKQIREEKPTVLMK